MGLLKWLLGKPNKKSVGKEPSIEVIFTTKNQENSFTFFVDGLQNNFKEFSHVGESVKLWIPDVDDPDKVYIYHRDGPGGCLGTVPSEKNFDWPIIFHLEAGKNCYAKIIELTENKCKIECRLISKEETKRSKEAEESIIKAKTLEKTNNEEAVCLYRKAMGILREIDQQCEKNFFTWRKQRFPINRLSLVLQKQKRYKECLEEIEAYEKLVDKVGLYAGEKEKLEKRKEKIRKIVRKDQDKH